MLLEVAQRISASIRAADTAARFGGDEFAILLEDVHDIQSAAETAERILEALARPLQLDHNDIVDPRQPGHLGGRGRARPPTPTS